MSNALIFKDKNSVAASGRARELTDLGKSLATPTMNRRVQTNTNGTFKRIVNGEQVGNAIRGEMNVIIVGALPKVSRTYYEGEYDPTKEATLPDCWSNLGDKPEAAAANRQHTNCSDCPKNVAGSGKGNSRACRFQRRVSVLLEDDPSGEVYQFNIPAMSLFGKGVGNVHPFESYVRYLASNGESPDTVVTNISYDLNADTMKLLFTPMRTLDDAEYDLVQAAQSKPETKSYTMLTVSKASEEKKAATATKAAAPKDEPEGEPVRRPNKNAAAKGEAPAKKSLASIVEDWAEDE